MTNFFSVIPEIVVGLILAGFAWAFRSWAETLRNSSEKILEKLERLARDFHSHKIINENRLTSVESELKAIERDISRIDNQNK